MKLILNMVATATTRPYQQNDTYARRVHIYESQPTKRTIIGINQDGDHNRYYVSFPWTYFLVCHSKVDDLGYWTFDGLTVQMRPGPMTHTNESLFSLNFPNGSDGAMCLGDDMPVGKVFSSVDAICEKAIGLFFETPFETEVMNIPLIGATSISSFEQWKEASKTIVLPNFLPINFGVIPTWKLFKFYDILWTELPTHAGKAKPRFTQDCDQCVFLGLYEEYDLYYCPQGDRPTVIARFGEGPEYYSGMGIAQFTDNDSHPLVEARERAINAGLDCNIL